jgi:uncharacterized protein YbjQ (UPF0145 family)
MSEVLVHCHLCEASVETDTRHPDEDLAAAGWVVRLGVTYCPNCAFAQGMAPEGAFVRAIAEGPLPMSTGQTIPGIVLGEGLGICFGVIVRSASLDPEAGRARALERLGANARLLGADGVVGVRFDSTDGELVAYGTAVRFVAH